MPKMINTLNDIPWQISASLTLLHQISTEAYCAYSYTILTSGVELNWRVGGKGSAGDDWRIAMFFIILGGGAQAI